MLIGKMLCLCLVIYIGVWDMICKLFVDMFEVCVCGYMVLCFLFNIGDGCCFVCEG